MSFFCRIFPIFCIGLNGTSTKFGAQKVPFSNIQSSPEVSLQDVITIGQNTIEDTHLSGSAAKKPISSEYHDINDVVVKGDHFHEFHYAGLLGPENWSTLYPSCGGAYQSPIALEKLNSNYASYGFFSAKNYRRYPTSATVTNNGHTAMITLIPDGITISGGNLPGEYDFLNFHFHWGSDSGRGSEHVMEGIHYPLELHMVHWNLKYHSSEEAMKQTDGIAVLAALFHVDLLSNHHLAPIIESLRYVIKSGTNMTFTPKFNLWDLLPSNTHDYYRYQGSLTTPECSESVIWTVFAKTLPISEHQLNEFRKLLDPENNDRENNHRPVQPLNSRIVYRNGLR